MYMYHYAPGSGFLCSVLDSSLPVARLQPFPRSPQVCPRRQVARPLPAEAVYTVLNRRHFIEGAKLNDSEMLAQASAVAAPRKPFPSFLLQTSCKNPANISPQGFANIMPVLF